MDRISRLYEINYSGKPVHIGNGVIEQYDLSPEVKKDLAVISDFFMKHNERNEDNLHLGAISSGAHTNDFIESFQIDPALCNSNHSDPVMFVYECPGNNLNASFFPYAEHKKINDLENYLFEEKKTLSSDCNRSVLSGKYLWHADSYGEVGNWKFETDSYAYFSGRREYSYFLQSLIQEFKLSNFYTTNLFRYELFRLNGDVERALNLGEICYEFDKTNGEGSFIEFVHDSVFDCEYRTLNPKVIFATSKPYKILKDYLKDEMPKPILIKVPHPAFYNISEEERFLKNSVPVIAGLVEAGIIEESFANNKLIAMMKIYRRFLR